MMSHRTEAGVAEATAYRAPYTPSRQACPHPFTNPYYLLCVASSIFIMTRQYLTVSDFSFVNHDAIANVHLASPWRIFAALGSVGLDFGDNQWRNFCDNFFTLMPFMLSVVLISRFIRNSGNSHTNTKGRLTPLAWFHCVIGLLFVTYLHGPRVVFMLCIVAFNYAVLAPMSLVVPYRVWMLCLWVFHIGALLINDRYKGYHFGSMFGAYASKLDSAWEVFPWNVVYNMSTLRMIAYCIDYEEASHRGTPDMRAKLEEKHRTKCIDCVSRRCACYKLRTDTPRPLAEYNLVHYLGYLFYIPLYIAGPMSSFNAYVSHIYVPQRWFGIKEGLRYGGRIVGVAITIFVMLHFSHIHAISAHPDLLTNSTVGFKVCFVVQALAFLWLKFNIFWKLFRLVALMDGFDVPEDMVRCFAGVTTIANFWRDWHASFNIWIIRYMYIPLGGNKVKVLAIFPIFGFIALWHDVEMKLFWWAAIMCLAFMPEAIGTAVLAQRRFRWIQSSPYFNQLRVAGSYVSIGALIAGNVVGYGAGGSTTSAGEGAGGSVAAPALVWSDVLLDFDVLCFLSLPLTSSYITWYLKDREYEAERRLKWECGILEADKKAPAAAQAQ